MIYADIESSSKLGGLRAIAKMQSENGSISYSLSDIDAGDPAIAMNCVIHIPYYNNNVRLNVIFQQCV